MGQKDKTMRGQFIGHITGNLTRDVEMKETKSGTAVANFSIAVNTDKDGPTTFVRCSAFGKKGELIKEYVGKGSPLSVYGTVQNRPYEVDGERRFSLEMTVDSFLLLPDGKGKGGGGGIAVADDDLDDI